MKAEIRNRIKQMRSEGYGYKRIAKELDITLSVVRYACSKMSEEDLFEGRCEQCGLKIKSIKGKKKKRFCSDQCRWDWWNNHYRDINRKTFTMHQCKCCAKEFTSYGNNKRIYCSHECYIKDKLSKGTDIDGTL